MNLPWRAIVERAHVQPSSWSRASSGITRGKAAASNNTDVSALLEQPTWAVSSLLEKNSGTAEGTEITPARLRHLLRLSALPLPANPEEEAAKLDTLCNQLRFVREVQSVETTGLQPLQAIRDETRQGIQEQTVGVKDVEQILIQEDSFGHNRRPRRRKPVVDTSDIGDWDVLATSSQTAGKYVVVNGARQ